MNNIDLHPRTLRRNIWYGLLCASDQEIQDGMDFYPGANGLCRFLSTIYKISSRQVAGIYAALSPMNGWDTNVANIVDVLRWQKGESRRKLDRLLPQVNTPNVNLHKAIEIADGKDPESILKGRKVGAFFRAINDPSDDRHVPVDRHLICLALGTKLGKNQLSRIASSREIYNKVESAYLDLGKREGIGNRLASIAWFVQRRIARGQIPILHPESPICCGHIMWNHGKTYRRFLCNVCGKSRPAVPKIVKRPTEIILDPDIASMNLKLGYGSKGRAICYLGQGHPFADSQGKNYLSRFVVQYTTGERLRSDEHVHHENGRQEDCRRDNLEVWLAERHGRYHARNQLLYMLRDRTGKFVKSEVPSFDVQYNQLSDTLSNTLPDIPF